MRQTRVFEIANQHGIDTRAVLEVLRNLGESAVTPESMVDASVAERVRVVLKNRVPERPQLNQSKPQKPRVPTSAILIKPPQSVPRQKDRTKLSTAAARSWHKLQRRTIESIIPATYAALRATVDNPEDAGVIIVFHNGDAVVPYGVCTISGDPSGAFEGKPASLRRVISPLRDTHGWFRERAKSAPNVFIAFDLAKRQAWFSQSLASVQNMRTGPFLNAETLDLISVISSPTTGEPPRLALRSQIFGPNLVPQLRLKVGDGADRPEEAFLLHEDLLRLAVDSLDGAEILAPLPIHVNALWVFSRPIVMQRSDGSDRHVRAVWFRQGAMMWRMRTYTAGTTMKVKQVGEQLAGRRPFVPVWDDTRPEQKLLAAIWALMSQGDVTENELVAQRSGIDNPQFDDASLLTIVRVKAGTDHALVYAPDGADGVSPRASWSVRGHWRHQPYPSLGHEENGRIKSKPIWISTYAKGIGLWKPSAEKVIFVGAPVNRESDRT